MNSLREIYQQGYCIPLYQIDLERRRLFRFKEETIEIRPNAFHLIPLPSRIKFEAPSIYSLAEIRKAQEYK